MSFNTYIFILAFMPLTVLCYYLLHSLWKPLGKAVLILASILFICYADARYLVFFAVSIAINYLLARLMKKKRILLALGVVGNVCTLGIYKYTGFIFAGQDVFRNLLVPLGISFVTFSQISFLVDVYRDEQEPVNLVDYICWVLYFPKLVQGPITKFEPFIKQLDATEEKVPDAKHISQGLWFFTIGLAQKVLLADQLAVVANYGYSFGNDVEALTSLEALLTMLCYTLQIYFDFSGYSHMAIGVSNLLGIDLPDNFDRPYIATSVTDFWKRWHITLTDFLRRYIYFPLGGSRKGTIRTYCNIMIIFAVSGIWHGAAWTFVLWGLIHGVFMCLNRIWDKYVKIKVNKLYSLVCWLFTFLYVNITWVFFRASSWKQALLLLKRGFLGGVISLSTEFTALFDVKDLAFLERKIAWLGSLNEKYPNMNMIILLGISLWISLLGKDKVEDFKPTLWRSILIIFLFLWSVISLSNVAQFIYGLF